MVNRSSWTEFNKSISNVTLCTEPTWGYNVTVTRVLGYCLIILPLLTVVVNLIVLVVISRAPKLKLCTRIFLFSLAACDICTGVFVMPFRIFGMVTENMKILGMTKCNFGNSVDFMLYISSLVHLCVLTFDRFLASCKPFKHGLWFRREYCVLTCIACWIIPAILAFGIIPTELHIRGIATQYSCILKITGSCQLLSSRPFALTSAVVIYVIPTLFILICNCFIITAIENRKKMFLRLIHVHTKRGSLNRRHIGMKLAQTVMAMATGCIVCWLPFFTVQSVDPLVSYRVPQYIITLVTWIGYAKSVASPLIYLKSTSFLRFRSMT